MQPMAIGIAGTAKNTGKTTTTATLMEGLSSAGIRLGLTSIGYDGEQVDNITGLPKPRLYLRAGDLVATAEKCLTASTASVKVLETTGISTPLGKVVLCEVSREGLVVVAGPNKSTNLRQVQLRLQAAGAELTIVDGALNRMAPMVETDGFILATGAARYPDINLLVNETKAVARLCGMPRMDLQVPAEFSPYLSLKTPGQGWTRLGPWNSLLDTSALAALNLSTGPARWFWVPGVVAEACWEFLAGPSGLREGDAIIVADPIKLLIGGGPETVHQCIVRLERKGVRVAISRTLPLVAITVNPFYPRYRYEAADYEPAYLAAAELLQAMQGAVDTEVFDVVQQGAADLAERVISFCLAPPPSGKPSFSP